jgi:hypothetical protein
MVWQVRLRGPQFAHTLRGAALPLRPRVAIASAYEELFYGRMSIVEIRIPNGAIAAVTIEHRMSSAVLGAT